MRGGAASAGYQPRNTLPLDPALLQTIGAGVSKYLIKSAGQAPRPPRRECLALPHCQLSSDKLRSAQPRWRPARGPRPGLDPALCHSEEFRGMEWNGMECITAEPEEARRGESGRVGRRGTWRGGAAGPTGTSNDSALSPWAGQGRDRTGRYYETKSKRMRGVAQPGPARGRG